MKIFRLRNLFLASSALALVMLFGCSSSEEAADESGASQSCAEQCASEQEGRQDECLITCEA